MFKKSTSQILINDVSYCWQMNPTCIHNPAGTEIT